MQNADGNGSTGIFAVWINDGIRDALDGTSSTLLIGEALVGDNKGNESTNGRSAGASTPGSHDRGNGIVVAAAKCEVDDFSSSPTTSAGILASLAACNAEWSKRTSVQTTSHRGDRWASF